MEGVGEVEDRRRRGGAVARRSGRGGRPQRGDESVARPDEVQDDGVVTSQSSGKNEDYR
jgi:hypothetical protein